MHSRARRVQGRNAWVFEPDEHLAAFLVGFDVRTAGSPLFALISWLARRYHAYAVFLTERNLYVCRRAYFRGAKVKAVEVKLPVGTFRIQGLFKQLRFSRRLQVLMKVQDLEPMVLLGTSNDVATIMRSGGASPGT